VIVRWGLDALPEVCAAAGVRSPLLVASPRWDGLELPLQPAARWREVPSDRVGEAAEAALAALRAHPLGREAELIGTVCDSHPGMVTMRTLLGTMRIVDMLVGDQLPRIC